MGIQGAFGKTGGAGGKKDEDRMVFIQQRNGEMGLFGFPATGVGKLLEVFHGPGMANRPEERAPLDRFVVLGLPKDQTGSGIFELVVDLGGGQPVVEGDQDGAGFLGGGEKEQVFEAVFGQHRDAVACFYGNMTG